MRKQLIKRSLCISLCLGMLSGAAVFHFPTSAITTETVSPGDTYIDENGVIIEKMEIVKNPKQKLGDLIASASSYYAPGCNWTYESEEAYWEALNNAKAVFEDSASTDEDYCQAYDTLCYVLDHLETEDSNKDALFQYLDFIDESGIHTNSSKYTKTSYSMFEYIFGTYAHTAYNPQAPQKEVDTALAFLQSAVEGLVLLGDVDHNNEIVTADALLLQRAIANQIALSKEALEAGDVDQSGTQTVTDVLLLQKYIAKQIEAFPTVE
ncbi:MAG: dockerin type I repeat-containing protein [Acutalibacteraceae bacterium]|nr:dockerin type I repeat-containing protein [Acutalibacteraceae bacterium]